MMAQRLLSMLCGGMWGVAFLGNAQAQVSDAERCAELRTSEGYPVPDDHGKCMCEPFAVAEAICAQVGARLCTEAELLADESRGTGCAMDNLNVWTSDTCPTGHIAADGDSRAQSNFVDSACIADTELRFVRCCASGADLCASLAAQYGGWPSARGDGDVCGESDNGLQPLSCTNMVELQARVAGLQAACCPGGIMSCPLNIPTSCEAECAEALLGFVGDCKDSFGADALAPILDPVLELCSAASNGADSEVGGGAIDHFVDGRLEGCTNVAEGRPATQSSVAWDGDASKAVDGNGLDGSWGSGSCTHTDGDGPTWWQVDLGQIQDIRAVQIVNRADCCQDRLVGARVIVSRTSDYTDRRTQSCGSVTEQESSAGNQDLIIKSCAPNTFGRYVTIQQIDDSYLTLCEVAVYSACGGSAVGSVTDGESHGGDCTMSFNAAPQSFADAEADCVRQGGHLASIHNDADMETVQSLVSNTAWIGMNDRGSECGGDGSCFVWTDGTPNDYPDGWANGEPNEWGQGGAHPQGVSGLGTQGDAEGGEDCAEAWRAGASWADANCNGAKPYVCRSCGGGNSPPSPPPPSRGSCSCNYQLHQALVDWQTAEDTCVADGGHLASAHSQANADAIQALVDNADWVGDYDSVWIGFTDSVEEGKFLWSDGSPSNDYENWAAGEPNDFGGGGEDCSVTMKTETRRGGANWADSPCFSSKAFVCGTPCRGNAPAGGGH